MLKKKFKDLATNRIVEVTDQFEDIIILDNKSKIRVNQLLDKRMFEEFVDPNYFFKNEPLLNSFAQQIKQLPLDNWENRVSAEDMGYSQNDLSPRTSESAVVPYDPEIEKEELLKKAQMMYRSNDTNNLIQKQMESLKGILSEDVDPIMVEDIPMKVSMEENSQQPVRQIIKEEIKTEIKMDPILEMFKNVKRNTNFKIDFTVENKIPRLDFIEMMEDSYNTSIIDFLAQEFTDQIVNNPDIIKDKIKGKLTDLVYPPDENKKEK